MEQESVSRSSAFLIYRPHGADENTFWFFVVENFNIEDEEINGAETEGEKPVINHVRQDIEYDADENLVADGK